MWFKPQRIIGLYLTKDPSLPALYLIRHQRHYIWAYEGQFNTSFEFERLLQAFLNRNPTLPLDICCSAATRFIYLEQESLYAIIDFPHLTHVLHGHL